MRKILAIHDRGKSFSKRWIERATNLGIDVKKVDGYSSSIIRELHGCGAFLWHLSHDSFHDLNFGIGILKGASEMGLITFPNQQMCSHFDDKVAQKYLLEAVDAPLVPTWVFFSHSKAVNWIEDAEFPLVFKLRRGAGSSNVRLVRSRNEAIALVKLMFGRGMTPVPSASEKFSKSFVTKSPKSIFHYIPKFPQYFRNHMRAKKIFSREVDYVYFQKFIPENSCDRRVTVIGDRAFTFTRRVRPGDFRASGSGLIDYEMPEQSDLSAIRTAFDISQKLGFQVMAYDFVFDRKINVWYIVEMSYVFNAEAVYKCPGYFDSDLCWHEGQTWPQDAIFDDVLGSLNGNSSD